MIDRIIEEEDQYLAIYLSMHSYLYVQPALGVESSGMKYLQSPVNTNKQKPALFFARDKRKNRAYLVLSVSVCAYAFVCLCLSLSVSIYLEKASKTSTKKSHSHTYDLNTFYIPLKPFDTPRTTSKLFDTPGQHKIDTIRRGHQHSNQAPISLLFSFFLVHSAFKYTVVKSYRTYMRRQRQTRHASCVLIIEARHKSVESVTAPTHTKENRTSFLKEKRKKKSKH